MVVILHVCRGISVQPPRPTLMTCGLGSRLSEGMRMVYDSVMVHICSNVIIVIVFNSQHYKL